MYIYLFNAHFIKLHKCYSGHRSHHHHHPILQKLFTSWGCTAACVMQHRVGDNGGCMWDRNNFLLENSCAVYGIFCIQFLKNLLLYLQWNRLKSLPAGKFVLHRCEALKCKEFLQVFPQRLGLVCVEKGYQRLELMRIPCTVFVCGYRICGGQSDCGMGFALSTGVLCCHLLFY